MANHPPTHPGGQRSASRARCEPAWWRRAVGLGQPCKLNGDPCDLLKSVLGAILGPDDLSTRGQQAQRTRNPISDRFIKLIVEPFRSLAQ